MERFVNFVHFRLKMRSDRVGPKRLWIECQKGYRLVQVSLLKIHHLIRKLHQECPETADSFVTGKASLVSRCFLVERLARLHCVQKTFDRELNGLSNGIKLIRIPF